MSGDNDDRPATGTGFVELTRVQPFEAEVIAARLRDSGIEATVGADSPYESVSFAEGVPVFVPAHEIERAQAVLDSTA
jgi:hypothetical protein